MVVRTATATALAELFEADETSWLEAMAEAARDGRAADLDLPNLAEYLADMARRDRREVESRLVVLLAHLLKWEQQADRRTRSWQATIVEQRQELRRLIARGVLRNHAEAVLDAMFREAVERTEAETGLDLRRRAEAGPDSLESVLDTPLAEGPA